jgi:hypothetical protein
MVELFDGVGYNWSRRLTVRIPNYPAEKSLRNARNEVLVFGDYSMGLLPISQIIHAAKIAKYV